MAPMLRPVQPEHYPPISYSISTMRDSMRPSPRFAWSPLLILSDFQHVLEDCLRLTDLDFQQHVNNATPAALLANARFDFLGEVVCQEASW